MYGPVVKVSIGARTKVLRTMRSDEERVELMRGLFGIGVEVGGARWMREREAALG
ncbi:hypothetical protein BDV98DRAFT_577229 [Pterulicium gracile]|uniref:Uncharacterized protein n=1 Tax=Pterulicium gracile TaxID=1884261 RepID=A0A5C3Q446_9AGAR|nr:hypothetical protein BDV98DRAFT_577229 [Pterula gracilis]